MGKTKKLLALSACLAVGAGILTGCGEADANSANDGSAIPASVEDKVFHFGTLEYDGAGVDPHSSYSGWYAMRYGIGETLVKISESGELEPWLAEDYANTDAKTWVIHIKSGITFQNGKPVDAAAVKACLERLIATHDRAPHDLQIDKMEADGQTLTIRTKIANPVLMNCLADPYGCIIDVTEEVDGENHVVGTGPYLLEVANSEKVDVKANMAYWNGTPKVGAMHVQKFTDGDTLAMAMQSGEIDAAQSLPYASLPLFQSGDYSVKSADTSRSFFIIYNQTKENLQDANVRKAIACAIDKEGFTSTLLNGNGTPAVGAFPSSYAFGDEAVHDETYDLEKARSLLEASGWKDTDGDGYVDKDGKKLTINWLTYPSRQELPLLAESAHATLKQIGIDVEINSVDNAADVLKANDFDVYAVSFVSAPTGDPQYFFTSFFADGGSYDITGWRDAEFDKLLTQLRSEFDPEKRSELAVQLQQILLDQNVMTVASHLKMSFVMQSGVSGFAPHPSDYYEITQNLDIAK